MSYICPKCHQESDHLTSVEPITKYFRYTAGGNYEDMGDDQSAGEPEYRCPLCEETLAFTEEEADAILRGEPIKEEADAQI